MLISPKSSRCYISTDPTGSPQGVASALCGATIVDNPSRDRKSHTAFRGPGQSWTGSGHDTGNTFHSVRETWIARDAQNNRCIHCSPSHALVRPISVIGQLDTCARAGISEQTCRLPAVSCGHQSGHHRGRRGHHPLYRLPGPAPGPAVAFLLHHNLLVSFNCLRVT